MPTPHGPTAKQRRFVEEYLVDLNATQASIRAGFSTKTAQEQGSRLLSNVMVAEAIRVAMSERSERTKITLDRVLEELALIAFSDMRDFVTWGPNGVRLKASDELPEKVARCVSELAESPGKYGSSIRLKLHDKLAALDKLARHIGFFGEDSTGDFSDLARLSDEELGNLGRKLKLTS